MNSSNQGKREPRVVSDYIGLAIVLAGLIAVFSLKTQYFLKPTTFKMITGQIPDAVIIAVGMTFVLIIAGIDLSVGGVLALSGAVLGVCLVQYKLPLPVAILACLAAGLTCGVVSGLVVSRWRIPSFIVTLGMMEISRGAAYLVTGSRTMYIGSTIEAVSGASVLGLSLPFLVAFVIVIVGQFVLARTVFGRHMIALGTNEEAARLSGISTAPVKVAVFAISGLLCAVAAVVQCSRLASADPNMGTGAELAAIAAVVIGGTSLMGGRGSVVSSFFGVLVIAVLGTGLVQVGAQEPTKRLITGCVIVAAVILDHYRHRLQERRR